MTTDDATGPLVGAIAESIVRFLPLTFILSITAMLLATFARGGITPDLQPIQATRRLAHLTESGVRHAHDSLGWAAFAFIVGGLIGLALILAWG